MIHFVSDTHFLDPNAMKYRWSRRIFPSIDFMNQLMVDSWNAVVGLDDLVYHLGDFCHNKATAEEYQHFREQLNGSICLVRGNHDVLPKDILMRKCGFQAVYDNPFTLHETKLSIWLCHYPVQRNLDYYTLTGHIHEHWRVQRKMLNVGVDVNNYTPLSIEDVEMAIAAENDGRWDANVYPDAPLDWRMEVSTKRIRSGNEPTLDILKAEEQLEELAT